MYTSGILQLIVSQSMPGNKIDKFKFSTTFFAALIASFCMYRTALWFCQPIISSSAPCSNQFDVSFEIHVCINI